MEVVIYGSGHMMKPSSTDNRESVAASTLRELRELAELSGNPGQFRELINLFLSELELALASMRGAIAQRNAEVVGKLAHGLKGSSASMGAIRLALLCRELEELVRHTELQEAKAQLLEIESEIYIVRDTLKKETSD
jgi:HPt (histidine-containing phosphotransfer) domain-containing protein